jgi:hypothetical protein
MRDEKGVMTIDTSEIHRIIREYFENLQFNKFENLKQMHKFVDTCNLPKLNQEDVNRPNKTH